MINRDYYGYPLPIMDEEGNSTWRLKDALFLILEAASETEFGHQDPGFAAAWAIVNDHMDTMKEEDDDR